LKAALKYLISTVLAVALLYWAFSSSHLSWSDILHTLSTANYTWVSVSIFISILAHYFRAVRWNQLLAVMKYHPGTTRTLSAVLIGYFANFIIPRMGEVSRCGSLQKTAEIPFEKSFGTVITERIVDLLCLGIVLGINLLIEFEPLQHYLFPNIHLPGNALLIAAGTLLLLAIFFIYKYKNQFFNLLESKKDTSKIIQLLMGWIDGIKSIFFGEKSCFIYFLFGRYLDLLLLKCVCTAVSLSGIDEPWTWRGSYGLGNGLLWNDHAHARWHWGLSQFSWLNLGLLRNSKNECDCISNFFPRNSNDFHIVIRRYKFYYNAHFTKNQFP